MFKKTLNSCLELFRKKEYYITNYDTLNAYGINFKVVSEDDLLKIKNVILKFEGVDFLDEKESKLFTESTFQFLDIDDLILEIKKIIDEDYRQTYFEAINENWDFTYYLSDSDNPKSKTLFIKNELKKKGSVIYNLIAIKKIQNKFYLRSFLE